MKKPLLLLLAALSLSACRFQETDVPEAAGTRQVLFHAVTDGPTRTAFGPNENGTYPAYWTENDSQVKLALNYTEPQDAEVSASSDGKNATFVAVLSPESTQAPYVFNALSPASAAKALSPSRRAWSINIPAVQTPLEASVDESAMLLFARSAEAAVFPEEVSLTFGHITAYGLLTLKNLNISGDAIERVEITATTPLVGSWYFGLEDGSFQDNGASSTLTLNTSSAENIWFACAPVDVSGQILVFTVYTGSGVLQKEVEIPDGLSFKSGKVARMSVDFDGIEYAGASGGTFTLLEDASLLQAGDRILILNADETYAISTNQKDSNREAAAVSVSDHTISDVPSNVQILTLEGNSNGWYLSTGSGYLANRTGNYNRLLTVSGKTDNATWTISIASSGAATVMAGAGMRNLLRFNPNNGSPLFSCYASGQEGIVIYREDSGASIPVEEDPLTEQSIFGYYLPEGSREYAAGKEQYSREYDANGGVTFTILNPEVKEQVEISGYRTTLVKGDKVNITLSHRKGRATVLSGTYNMTVVKEDGARVWLGNGTGNGFIIKK